MSSGWLRDAVIAAPVPFGWKLCFSVEPKAICLTVSAPPLAAAVLALAELELELEHPAVPSTPAATTAAPSQVAVRRLKIFTQRFVCDLSDAQSSGVQRAGERLLVLQQ